MSKPLLTVTLNPALDLTGHIDQIQVGSVNGQIRQSASGR